MVILILNFCSSFLLFVSTMGSRRRVPIWFYEYCRLERLLIRLSHHNFSQAKCAQGVLRRKPLNHVERADHVSPHPSREVTLQYCGLGHFLPKIGGWWLITLYSKCLLARFYLKVLHSLLTLFVLKHLLDYRGCSLDLDFCETLLFEVIWLRINRDAFCVQTEGYHLVWQDVAFNNLVECQSCKDGYSSHTHIFYVEVYSQMLPSIFTGLFRKKKQN